MKILVAIESSGSNNAEQMAHTTLRWAGRSGFNTRIFVPNRRGFEKYEKAIEEANYHYLLSIPYSCIIVKQDPAKYAEKEGYDLLLRIPDDLLDWRTKKDDDKTVIDYAEDVGAARVEFGTKPDMQEKIFPNGAIMTRVQNGEV